MQTAMKICVCGMMFAGLVSACGDDPQPAGLVQSGHALVRNGYALTDYTVPAGTSELVVTNLRQQERIVIIPLDSEYATGPAKLRQVGTLRVEYAGPAPRELAPRHRLEAVPHNRISARDKATAFSGTARLVAFERLPARHPESKKQPASRATEFSLGQSHDFFVIYDFNDFAKGGVAVSSRLLYKGTHCYVWLTAGIAAHARAGDVATNAGQAFDATIYSKVTGLFGSEWGGDGDDGSGGIDGDKRVHILFQDVTKNPPGGYFSGRDEYYNTQFSKPEDRYSNEKEMFYICQPATYMDTIPNRNDVLAHEFQHLVHHNQVRRKQDASPLSYINEGFSQLAETWCGYGPMLPRFAEVHNWPRTSWLVWYMEGRERVDSYYAAYVLANYLVRRFGLEAITTVRNAPPSSQASLDVALARLGYGGDWPRLVLDMLTALWLDRDEFAFPAVGLHPGDSGIPMTGSRGYWTQEKNGFSNMTNILNLQGVRTRFLATFPATIPLELYQYGSDMFELVSGAGGQVTLRFENMQLPLRVRVVRFGGEGADTVVPFAIDGYGADWKDRTGLVTVADPVGDATMVNGKPSQFVCDPGADMTNVVAFCSNDVLYMRIQTVGVMHPTDKTNRLMLKLRLSGSADQFNVYCYDSRFFAYTISPSAEYPLVTHGVRYARRSVIELALPIGIFGITPDASIRVQPLMFNVISTSNVFDWGPALTVPR